MHTIIITIALSFLTLGLFAQTSSHKYAQIDKSQVTLEELKKELAKNPESEKANYNIAIYYYNQGVELIENMDYDADREALVKTQEEVMELFTTAMSYAELAHEANPSEKKTLTMLSGICFGVNDMEKKEYYDGLLQAMN